MSVFEFTTSMRTGNRTLQTPAACAAGYVIIQFSDGKKGSAPVGSGASQSLVATQPLLESYGFPVSTFDLIALPIILAGSAVIMLLVYHYKF